MSPTLERHRVIIIFTTTFSLLLIFGIFFLLRAPPQTDCEGKYRYINTNVVCGSPDVIKKTNYEGLRNRLISYADSKEKAGELLGVGIYFRDLEHGPVFGVNELENFAPASLLKLPLAITYFALEEQSPGMLGKQIKYYGTASPFTQNFPPKVTIEPDRFYTIDQLLFNTLVYSDNKSHGVLVGYLEAQIPEGDHLLLQTYQELGVVAPQATLEENINVRSYASIFRILYNASYLDGSFSEKVLSLLSQSHFRSGIVAGVPSGMTVAHKFGELTRPDGTKQLHDCGIIYYPDNPYVLCIMTRGNEWQELENTIQTLSKMVYEEVDSRRLP